MEKIFKKIFIRGNDAIANQKEFDEIIGTITEQDNIYLHDAGDVVVRDSCFSKWVIISGDRSKAKVYGSSTVRALMGATIELYDASMAVNGSGAKIIARDKSMVYCLTGGSTEVEAYDDSRVISGVQSKVDAWDRCVVVATMRTAVHAHNQVKVFADEQSTIFLYDDATVVVYGDRVTVIDRRVDTDTVVSQG